MSNIGSTALNSKQSTNMRPHVSPPGVRQQAFQAGTRQLLDEARGVVENAVGQGQEINPMIYQMLGLQPTYEDHTADLQQAQGELDASQQQYNEAMKTMQTLRAVPAGKRTRDQRQQLASLKKGMPAMVKATQTAQEAFGRLQTSPKTITGLQRLDPTAIPAESPFSAQNPLNQAQAAEEQRLNQYLSGNAAVDPTLVHQYDSAEQALRAKLAQRFGPDYENSSVGQMALQNFSRQKNEAYATWNQQMVEQYQNLAFSGQANLQSLLAQRIGLMQEPGQNQVNLGNALGNTAQQRLQQQQIENQRQLGEAGVSTTTSNYSPAGAIGGLSNLLTTPYNSSGDTLASKGINAGVGLYNSALARWTNNGAAAANAAASPAYNAGLSNLAGGGASAAGDVGAGMSSEAGASLFA